MVVRACVVVGIVAVLGGAARADLVAPPAPPAPDGRADGRARCRKALEPRRARATGAVVLVDTGEGVELRRLAGKEGPGFVLATCTAGVLRVPQGRLTLPPGWIAVDGQGVDSRVGAVYDARDAERLHYDIGPMAGSYTRRDEDDRGPDAWSVDEPLGATTLHVRLQKGTLRMNLEPFTNLWGPARSRADAEALVAIARTLKP